MVYCVLGTSTSDTIRIILTSTNILNLPILYKLQIMIDYCMFLGLTNIREIK